MFTFAAFAGEPKDEDGGKRDNPIEREQWFLHGRTFQGHPASALLQKAQQQRDKLRAETLRRNQVRNAAAAAPPAPAIWTELGPSPLRSVATVGVDGDFGLVTGRATAVVVDQNDLTGNTVYLGGAYGGVWKSTNATNSDPTQVLWKPIIDDQATTAVGAIAVQPGNGNLLLVGTGEANSSTDSYYGLGILRSTDAGNSWTLISSANGGLRPFHGLAFAKIAFSTKNPLVVVAATAAAVQGTSVGAEIPPNTAATCANSAATATCRGLYYSSDGGITWNQATMVDPAGTPDNGSASSVIYNPQQQRFYAWSRAHGLYSSVDGQTFIRAADQGTGATTTVQPSLTINLANCPSSPPNLTSCPIYRGEIAQVFGRDEMYVWYVDSSATPVNGGIYRTVDGGNSWTSLNVSGINTCGDLQGCGTDQGDYNLALAAIPNGSATDIYAGAINIYRCQFNSTNNSTCSTPGFVNLTRVYGCTPSGSFSNVHPDQHAFDSWQSNPNFMYFANDGGVYRTRAALNANNVSASTGSACSTDPLNPPIRYPFENLNSTMGSMTQFVWFSQHPTDQSTLLGGTQDNGSPAIFGASGLTWHEVQGGDGGFNDINPNNANEWFASFPRVQITHCVNGTSCTDSQFSLIVPNGSDSSSRLGGDSAAFYMPFSLDPQNSNELLIGTCRVWRITTLGRSAVALSQKFDLTGGTTACTSGSTSFITAITAGGPLGANGSQVIYAGTDDGKVFVNTSVANTLAQWNQASNFPGFSNPSNYPISGIAIDPVDATGNTALVTVMGFQTAHVLRTANGGNNWTDITGNLPDSPADAVVVDKTTGTIYVGTDVGVFSTPTPNGASTAWTEVGPATGTGALPNVAITRLAIFNPAGGPALLRVSTYGRGIWQTPLAASTTPDYSLAISNPALVAFPGQSVTFNGTITAFNGYNSAVTLSCDPQPCTPNPAAPNPAITSTFTATTSSSTVQDFSFFVKGVGSDASALLRQVPVSLRVIDFTLGSLTPVTNLVHGTSTTVQVSVTPLGSFNQSITFACSGLPAGMTCSAPAVTPSPGGTATTTLTITTTAATLPGPYTLTVTATTAGLPTPKQQPLSVQVIIKPDFNLGTPAFTSPTRKVGQALSSVITFTQQDGYTGTVNLSCTGAASSGIAASTCSFTPPSVTIGATPVSATLTVPTTSPAVAGNGQVTVLATDGTLSHTAALPFSLTDYTLTNLSAPNNAAPGGTVIFTYQLTPVNGYNSPVALSCDTSGFTVAVTCAFNQPNPLTLVPGTTTTVSASMAIPATEPNATYTVIAKTNDAAFTTLAHNQTTASFQISSTPDFTLPQSATPATPANGTVAAGGTATATFPVSVQGTFNSAITFTVGGCPSLATCTVTPNPASPTPTAPVTVTITVVTKAASVGALRPFGGQRNYLAMFMGLSFGTVGIVFLRRQRPSASLMLIACVLLLGLAACGGGGGGSSNPTPVPQPGTPAGTYTIVVTGTSGTTVHTTNFTLIVQ